MITNKTISNLISKGLLNYSTRVAETSTTKCFSILLHEPKLPKKLIEQSK